MNDKYQRGDRVKHEARTDWGLGEVLADQAGDKVQVIFEDAGLKMFSVDVAPLVKVVGEEAQSDHLSLLAKQERKKIGKSKNSTTPPDPFTTFPMAIEHFLRHFPGGFQDPRYVSSEREYKLVPRRLMVELLGREEMQALITSAGYEEICDRARRVINKTNLLSLYEKLWLAKGTASPGRQQLFATSLDNYLYGEEPAEDRFNAFAKMLYDIEAAKWPVATYFSFLAFPENQIFLKPQVTKHAANVLHQDIHYTPRVTWLTYSHVLKLAEEIKSRLLQDGREVLVPRDMIDIQSFIWVIGAYDD